MSRSIRRLTVHSSTGRPAAGIKGRTFAADLVGCDLFTGPNGAGKTSRLLAVVAALEGLATVPTDPRRPYLGPMLPSDTAVTLDLDDGASLTRDLALTTRAAAHGETTAEARRLVGIPPTAWDLSDFAAGTDGDRGRVLDAVAKAGGAIRAWTQVDAAARVGEIVTDTCPDTVALDAWMGPHARAVAQLTQAPDGASWLTSALTWAEQQQQQANAAQRSAKAHADEAGSQAPAAVPGDERAEVEERERMTARRAELSHLSRRREEAIAALARHTAEGDRLRAALVATEAEGRRLGIATPKPDDTIPQALRDRLAAADAELAAPMPPLDLPDVLALSAAVEHAESIAAAASREVERLTVALETAREQASTAHASEDAARQALATAESLYQYARLDSQRADTASADADAILTRAQQVPVSTCRHCGAADPTGDAPDLDILAERTAAASEAATVARAAMVQASEAVDTARAALLTATAAHRKAAAEVGRLEAELTAAQRTEHDAIRDLDRARAAMDAARSVGPRHEAAVRAQRQRERDSAQADLDRAARRIADDLARWTASEERRKADLTAARKRYADTRAALATWEAAPAPVVPDAADSDEPARIASRLVELDAIARRRADRSAAVRMAQRAVETYDAAKVEWDATRALVSAVRQARDELADAAYMPIQSAAQDLLRDAQAHGLPLPYFAGPADYGAINARGDRVPYAGLSESEQRITAAALVYALAVVARNPVRLVLLDGLEVVTRDHRAPLLRALADARAAGLVDNVIATMATAPGEDVSDLREVVGLTIHNLA